MIMTTGGSIISDTSGARISGFIGGDGGFIYQNAVCSPQATASQWACGSYGSWSVNANTTYGFNGASGYIASRTFVSPQSDSSLPWLARTVFGGSTGYNTMSTSLFLGGQSFYLGSNSALTTGGLYTSDGSTPASIYAQGGTIDLQGGSIRSNIGAAHNLTIDLEGNNGSYTGGFLINASAPCSVVSYNSTTGYWVNGSGQQCSFAINASSITVPTGTIEAFNFYAQTFLYQGSDIRLKRDIHPLDNSLDKIMQIKPVAFTYKADGKNSMGVIAQDLEKVYPQLVTDGDKGMKYVNYEGLIGPLIDSVQELKKENDDLRQQILIQKKRQNKFEQEVRKHTAE
jgi:hypothetical protein